MLSPGYRIADHALVRRMATGATSDVYEARHLESGAPAAVKVLHGDWCLDREVVTRFLNEALALQHLQHPHVVRVFECGVLPAGPPFMVLEWLPIDLHQALSRTGGGFSPEVAVRVAAQLADALAALHAHGLVHRDLKPANVLLSQEDPAVAESKLADLGLAKLLSGDVAVPQAYGAPAPLAALPISTGGSALLGTWEYMAPEQWVQSKNVDPRVDVYSLGVLLFQMLAGRLPFVAKQQKDWMYFHVMEAPPLQLLDGRATAGMRDLVARMMGKKPFSRPTMGEVVATLACPAA
jgi:serine/threonine-protein kinase